MFKVFITKLNIKYETVHSFIDLINKLEGTARYAGLPIAPAEGFGLMQSCFFALTTNKDEVLGQFRQFLGFSSNLSNL